MLLSSLLLCNGAIGQIQEDADASASLIAQIHEEIADLHGNMSKAFADVKLELEYTHVADAYYDAPDKVVVWVEHGKFRIKHYVHHDGEIIEYEYSFDEKKYYDGEQDEKEIMQPAQIAIYDPFSNTNEWLGNNSFLYLHYAGVHVPVNGAYMQHFPYFGSRLEHLLKKGESVSVYDSDGKIIVKCVVPDYLMLHRNKWDIDEERKSLFASPMPEDVIDSIISDLENERKAVPKRKIEIHLDPDYGFAPVYMLDNSMDGRETEEVRAKDWKRYKDYDIWLPSNVIADYVFDSDRYRTIYRLKNLEFRFEDNVNYELLEEYDKPATFVRDYTDPDAKNIRGGEVRYFVGADGELTKKRAEAIIAEINRSKKLPLLLLASIVILLGSIVYIWKK